MPKISKIELRIREEILKKSNLLKALEFDVQTFSERVEATKNELTLLNELLFDGGSEGKE